MKQLLRNLAIIVIGAGAALLLVAVGTGVLLSITSWGKAVSGQTRMPIDPWSLIARGYYILLSCVFLPSVLIVGFLVGKLARAFSVWAAAFAVLPVCILASGLRLEFAWSAALLLIIAGGTAYMSSRSKERHRAITAPLH